MLHKLIFKAVWTLKEPGVIPNYNHFQETQWFPFEQLKYQQEQQLVKLIEFAYRSVPYYHKLFNNIGLAPGDVRTGEDLAKIPILKKQTIKENGSDFVPKNLARLKFVSSSTSGSTGTPLKYRVSRADREISIALAFRGRGYAGYKLGDKVGIISSRTPTTKPILYRRLKDCLLNHRTCSYFKMNQKSSMKCFIDINRFKPSFVLAGPLPISLFAKFIQDNNLRLKFQPTAIFTNGEKLFDQQRAIIEKVFGAEVFDNYGLNDGGISAYECKEHNGMHIDMERSIVEVVNDDDQQIINQVGKILATSLHNYALPFIRYDTGDLGIVSGVECTCQRKTPLLKEVVGRIEGFISTPSGHKIHGTVIANLLAPMENVSQFQVIQDEIDEIIIKIVPVNWQTKEDIYTNGITKLVSKNDKDLKVRVQFVYEGDLEYTKAGKYKFVINNLEHG